MDFQAELYPLDPPSAVPLRPLTTGEIFDRSFSLYRQHFWLFSVIALVPALVSLIGGIARITMLHLMHLPAATTTFAHPGLAIFTVPWGIIALAIYGSSQAASTFGVSSVYLGRSATAMSCYRESFRHWFRYPALIVVQFLNAGWITFIGYIGLFAFIGLMPGTGFTARYIVIGVLGLLFLLSLPYTVFRYIKLSLAMPASVVEDLSVRASLKRSKALTLDRKWRIFLVFVLVGVLYLVIGTLLGLLTLAALRGKMHLHLVAAQLISLLTVFGASLLLQPVVAMSICLIYIDERVRREGFDIELMLQNANASSPDETAGPTGGLAEV